MQAALSQGAPEIFNTDQGSQFAAADFTGALRQRQIRISMDGRGRRVDNVFLERLWRSVKYELIYPEDLAGGRQLWMALENDFRFYNHSRPHRALGYRTPAKVFASRAPCNRRLPGIGAPPKPRDLALSARLAASM